MKYNTLIMKMLMPIFILISFSKNGYTQITGTVSFSGPSTVSAGQSYTYTLGNYSPTCGTIVLSVNPTWTVSPSGATITPNPVQSGVPQSVQIIFPNNCTNFTINCQLSVGPNCPSTPGTFTGSMAVTNTNCLTTPVFNQTHTSIASCNTTPLTFAVNSVSGSTSFFWSYPTGWTVSGASNGASIVLVPDGVHGGIITCNATNGSVTTSASTSVTITSPVTASINIGTCTTCEAVTVGGSLLIDAGGANNGDMSNALKFGGCGNGEAIASKRTSTGNQFGLDFYTNFTNKMSLTNGGYLGIGTSAPAARIHAIGNGIIDNSGVGGSTLILQGNQIGSNFPVLSFGQINSAGAKIIGAALWGEPQNNGNNNNEAMDLTFRTKKSLASLAEVMRITNLGTVGIGTSSPNAKLSVVTTAASRGIYTSITSTGAMDVDNGLQAEAIASGSSAISYGVYSRALGTGAYATNVGVTGIAGGGYVNYGVYGTTLTASSYPNTAAGYFDGDLVYTGGLFNGSDEKLKTNIKDLKNGLSLLKKLQPKTYDFKADEYKNSMNLPEGNQMGLIAQNLQSVFPGLVKEKVALAHTDPKSNEKMGNDTKFLSVNYMGLIPLLIQVAKEMDSNQTDLKKDVAQLKTENEELKRLINEICSSGCAGLKSGGTNDQANPTSNQLLQNVPNPFSQSTTIGYILNVGMSAFINVNSLDGKLVKHLELTVKGQGSVSINANELNAGTYTYTMYVDNNIVATKLMVISSQQ